MPQGQKQALSCASHVLTYLPTVELSEGSACQTFVTCSLQRAGLYASHRRNSKADFAVSHVPAFEAASWVRHTEPAEIPPPKDLAAAKSVKRGIYKIVGLIPNSYCFFYSACLSKYQYKTN